MSNGPGSEARFGAPPGQRARPHHPATVQTPRVLQHTQTTSAQEFKGVVAYDDDKNYFYVVHTDKTHLRLSEQAKVAVDTVISYTVKATKYLTTANVVKIGDLPEAKDEAGERKKACALRTDQLRKSGLFAVNKVALIGKSSGEKDGTSRSRVGRAAALLCGGAPERLDCIVFPCLDVLTTLL